VTSPADLTELVEHYRRRHEMTPSERQHYLDEDGPTSIEPERSAYARAARYVADNLLDVTGMTWTLEQADALGIDRNVAMLLMTRLAQHVEQYGRPLDSSALAMLREHTENSDRR
jgi:hypothetical protein